MLGEFDGEGINLSKVGNLSRFDIAAKIEGM